MHCVLMYHSFGSVSSPAADSLYQISDEQLHKQLSYLKKHNVNVAELGSIVSNPGILNSTVSITIDDGHLSIITNALPILLEYQIPSTVFLVTGLVGTPGFLSWSDVRECRKLGMTFQSHTHTHKLLNRLTEPEMRDELLRSKKVLEDALGEPVDGLALPGGAGDLDLLALLAQELGYRYIATSEWGYNRKNIRPFQIERISFIAGMNDSSFQKFISGDELLIAKMRLRKRLLAFTKNAVGEKHYNQLRRLFS